MKTINSQRFGRLPLAIIAATAVFGTLIATAPLSHAMTVKPPKPMAKLMPGEPAELQRCQGCHGPELTGKPGRTPSLHASGVLKEYSKANFERVLDTGVTNDGGMVSHGMPVFHWTKAQADQAYAFLKKLK